MIILMIGVVFVLFVYKRVFNQDVLFKVKDQIVVGFFEVCLFNDDFGVMLCVQGDLLKYNVCYMGFNLVFFFWFMIFFVLVMVQVQFYMGYQGFELGDEVVLMVQFVGEFDFDVDCLDLVFEMLDGVIIEFVGVWVLIVNEMVWCFGLQEIGEYNFVFCYDGEEVFKFFVVMDDWVLC